MEISLHGTTLNVVSGRNDAYWQRIAGGSWEPQTFRILERFIDRGHCYLDIGAFVGPTLLYGCQLARRAYGFEPDPLAFAELKRNVELNRPLTDNVEILEVCLAPRTGRVSFGSAGQGGDSVSSVLFGNRKTHWTVAALSFDDFARQYDISDCNFIKMDIEGGEYDLLPTMIRHLRAHRPTVYLSLHPCHLGKRKIGWIGKIVARAVQTTRIRPCLRVYKHIYDSQGRPLSFGRLFWICLRKVTVEIVLTDLPWGSPAPSDTAIIADKIHKNPPVTIAGARSYTGGTAANSLSSQGGALI